MKKLVYLFFVLSLIACKEDPIIINVGSLQLVSAKKSGVSLLTGEAEVPLEGDIILTFSAAIDPSTNDEIQVSQLPDIKYENLDKNTIVSLSSSEAFQEGESYDLVISEALKGEDNETFPGISIPFSIARTPLSLESIRIDERELESGQRNLEIPLKPNIEFRFSEDLETSDLNEKVRLVGAEDYNFNITKTEPRSYLLVSDENLGDLEKINLVFPSSLGESFETSTYELFTVLDSTPKFPQISDEELLSKIQEQTFKYFWDFGHPVSGLARERNTSGEIVTTGGSGFGLMAMVVAVERGFISREEAITRWKKVVTFLETADRFHGAWSHWLNGSTGRVQPFSAKDNGGDLVETAFLIQGLLTVRQYLSSTSPEESALAERITTLWREVEWSWYTKGGEKQLYWHWSPEFEWDINLPISGHNETQIIYTLAAGSPTFPIDKETYTNGYTRNGNLQNGGTFYGIELPAGFGSGGPLFFSHYSYLGMDPRNLADAYVDYWEQNVNHTLINRAYCIDNPRNFVSYSADCWGLTASDNNEAYSAHSPDNDLGVITPTAAISSIVYTPEESLKAIRHFYYLLGDRLWGDYGFYDAFNPTAGWYASSYLAIDQGPIICMIENYRSGLLWDLFMSAPEVIHGLEELGFTY